MKVIVKPHSVEIKKEEVTNKGEYNVQSCEFQFSSEYDSLKKVAVFSKGSDVIEIDLTDDTCIIPYEMLETEGIVTLGVYGYEVDGDNLVKRYSPTTDRFLVQSGSYKLGEEPTPPSPSVIEKLQADVQKNTDDIATLNTNLTNYYTKQETNNLLDNKADTEDIPDLTDYVKNTDYATSEKGGVVKTSANYGTEMLSGTLRGNIKTYAQYLNFYDKGFISKGTLENVLNARIGDIDTILTTLTTGNGV